MSRTWKDSKQYTKKTGARQRRISVRSVLNDPPDTRRLARALIALVVSQQEAAAAATDSRSGGGLPAAKDLTNREVRTFPKEGDE